MSAKSQLNNFKVPKITTRRFYIINLLKEQGVLSRRQINQLVFNESDYGIWKCRVELKTLHDAKLIMRGKCMSVNDYVYWIGKSPGQIDHRLGVNDVWLAVRDKVNVFVKEYDFGTGIADAYCVVDDRPYFVEYQRYVSKDIRDKVVKYEQYALSKRWDTKEWPMPGRFARVVVVVDDERDKVRYDKVIKSDTVKFVVCLKENVKDVIK